MNEPTPQLFLFSDPLSALLQRSENENLEFKEAKNRYDFEELVRYCAALANEGGGKMVLGVTKHQQVVGTSAFNDLERTKAGLVQRLYLRITAEVIAHPQGRVVVFSVPSRPLGIPIQYKGAYWMRSGDSLVPMTNDQLRKILDETGPDFSAEPCKASSLDDLDPMAIEEFRRAWQKKSANPSLAQLSVSQLLTDAELIINTTPTYAGLILLGKRAALGRFLGQAEVIFEYRATEISGPAQQRKEFRQGFLSYREELWSLINSRNELQHYQTGLFIWDIPTFNEGALREAISNAISHRDYRLASSIFIRQYPRKRDSQPGWFSGRHQPRELFVASTPAQSANRGDASKNGYR